MPATANVAGGRRHAMGKLQGPSHMACYWANQRAMVPPSSIAAVIAWERLLPTSRAPACWCITCPAAGPALELRRPKHRTASHDWESGSVTRCKMAPEARYPGGRRWRVWPGSQSPEVALRRAAASSRGGIPRDPGAEAGADVVLVPTRWTVFQILSPWMLTSCPIKLVWPRLDP